MSEIAQVKPGDCIISVHYDGPGDRIGRLRVEQADPVVWMSAELARPAPQRPTPPGLLDRR